jgi:hypothetical protein
MVEIGELLLGIGRLGYRGAISERCLSSLLAHAREHGLDEVLSRIADDSGYLVVPSWQFALPWEIRASDWESYTAASETERGGVST